MNEHVGARASRPHRGWHERGYLPHFDAGAIVQMITFRLADSLPRQLYERAAVAAATKQDRYLRLEKIIDEGRGACMLCKPQNASIVQDAMTHFDGERYRLVAWVVMPNHVHALIEQVDGYQLGDIVKSWKSFSAHAINRREGKSGPIWAADYFDRYIRNEEHYANARFYIESNPVKAKLAASASAWPFSSASVRVE
jgi:putative transposase